MKLHEAAGTPIAASNISDGQAVVVVVWENAVEGTFDSVEV
jgi:hypothetical protein